MRIMLSLLCVGFLVGVMSGFFGVGGGFILVPLLVYVLGYSQLHAQGLSLGLLTLPVTIVAAISYYKRGDIQLDQVLYLAFGFIIGGYLASIYVYKVDQWLLQKIFGVLLFFISLKILFLTK